MNLGQTSRKMARDQAAPANRARTVPRRYRGVGRVLIARLVAQSWVEGGRGKILVSPRPGTEPFYVGLGFRFVRPMRSALVLNEMGAATLMKAALMEGTRSKP